VPFPADEEFSSQRGKRREAERARPLKLGAQSAYKRRPAPVRLWTKLKPRHHSGQDRPGQYYPAKRSREFGLGG